jgi:acyl-CoA thioesterase-1
MRSVTTREPLIFVAACLVAAMTGISAFWGPELRWLLQPPAPRIVFIGDSLTSGRGLSAVRAYPAVLQHRLDEAGWRYRVVNAGVSGDTSGRALDRLPRALDGDVRLLVVALGANDALRGVPIAQLKANLARIIEAAQGRRIRVLLCGLEGRSDGSAYTTGFHAAYRELAARYRVPLVPFMLEHVIDDSTLMQPDSLHPNAAGAVAIAGNIWPYLEPLVEADAATAQ